MEEKYKAYLDAISDLIEAVEACLDESSASNMQHMEKMLERVKIERMLIK